MEQIDSYITRNGSMVVTLLDIETGEVITEVIDDWFDDDDFYPDDDENDRPDWD